VFTSNSDFIALTETGQLLSAFCEFTECRLEWPELHCKLSILMILLRTPGPFLPLASLV
jgi:hypothetical protein